ncbi:MAG: hypothetical protein ACRDRA_10815 [Pseudonocardiaceae bacterium]
MQRTGPDEARTEPPGLPRPSEPDVALGFLFGAEVSRPVGDRPEGEPARALRAALRPALGSTVLLTKLTRGGSLVTGDYGDEVLGGHRANLLRMALHRRGRGLRREEW